jgi:antitoxin VapB
VGGVDADAAAADVWQTRNGMGAAVMTTTTRVVRLFRHGRHQMIRIPREFEMPGNQAVICREGQRLVLEPTQRPSLSRLLAGWSAMDVGWPAIADSQPESGISRRCGGTDKA